MAKGRKTGGRQKGVPNKASIKRQEEIASSGATPLATIVKKMRFHLPIGEEQIAKGEEMDTGEVAKALDKAAEAARDAAPYVHPRLAAIQHTGKDGGPIESKIQTNVESPREKIK